MAQNAEKQAQGSGRIKYRQVFEINGFIKDAARASAEGDLKGSLVNTQKALAAIEGMRSVQLDKLYKDLQKAIQNEETKDSQCVGVNKGDYLLEAASLSGKAADVARQMGVPAATVNGHQRTQIQYLERAAALRSMSGYNYSAQNIMQKAVELARDHKEAISPEYLELLKKTLEQYIEKYKEYPNPTCRKWSGGAIELPYGFLTPRK